MFKILSKAPMFAHPHSSSEVACCFFCRLTNKELGGSKSPNRLKLIKISARGNLVAGYWRARLTDKEMRALKAMKPAGGHFWVCGVRTACRSRKIIPWFRLLKAT